MVDTYCTGGDGEITITIADPDLGPDLDVNNFNFTWFKDNVLLFASAAGANTKANLEAGEYVIEVEAQDVAALNGKGRGCSTSITRTITNDADEISLAAQVPDVTIDDCDPDNATITVTGVLLDNLSTGFSADATGNYTFSL